MSEAEAVDGLDETQLDLKLNIERKLAEYYKTKLEILKVKVQIAEMEQKLKEPLEV